MDDQINVEPLPYKTRQKTFGLLLIVFVVSLPFLYLYATGYRFDFKKPTNLVSTGGMYVAVDRTGAEIYIDGELVRETRAFRRAFYAQSLDIGTHRVHVQKEGQHTWVKELPVSKHLVTEAEAFNLPLVPQVRIISQWQSATGSPIVRTPLLIASSTNDIFATTTMSTTTFVINEEYMVLIENFSTSSLSAQEERTAKQRTVLFQNDASSTPEGDVVATTTVISGGVKLFESNGNLFATWIGPFEQMPYYYCAPDFPAYSTSTELVANVLMSVDEKAPLPEDDIEIIHPVQTIPADAVCDQSIRIDRKGQEVHDFDFFPGSTDFVVLIIDDGIYVAEIDDRSWQNVQPLIMGENLQMYIENGNIFVYDGILIYQIILQTE